MVVFYAPLSRLERDDDNDNYEDDDNNGGVVQPESWYALLNLWGLLTDSLYYYGHGKDSNSRCTVVGNGLTINDDIITSTSSSSSNRNTNPTKKYCKSSAVIIALRTTLSIMECVAPAVEVTTYYSISSSTKRERHTDGGSGSTSTSRSVDSLRSMTRLANALRVVTNMERIKFVCRSGIVVLNYWNVWHTQFRFGSSNSPTTASSSPLSPPRPSHSVGGNDGDLFIPLQTRQLQLQDKKQEMARNIALSGVGILQNGGLLQPEGDGEYRSTTTQSSEERRVSKLMYVGKRTGRRVVQASTSLHSVSGLEESASLSTATHAMPTCGDFSSVLPSTSTHNQTSEISIGCIMETIKIKARGLLLRLQQSPPTTAKRRFGYLLMGELLHIYRPLHWAKVCYNSESSRSQYCYPPHNRLNSKDRTKLMKSWILCLAMDVISHKLSNMGTHVSTRDSGSSGKNDNGGGDCSNGNVSIAIDVSSQTTKEELNRRKMRWILYLLRAPIWSLFTYPLTKTSSKALAFCMPLVGRPLATYLMDLLLYWQKWHFMLES